MTDQVVEEGTVTGGGKGEEECRWTRTRKLTTTLARFKINLGNGAASSQSGKASELKSRANFST